MTTTRFKASVMAAVTAIMMAAGVSPAMAATAKVTTAKPTVSTQAATLVSATSATVNGTVADNGLATTTWFQWGKTTSYGHRTPKNQDGAAALTGLLTGLKAGTVYDFRAVAKNSKGTVYGVNLTFKTAPAPTGPPILSNSCSAGYVTFTFDDGPGPTALSGGNTQNMINQLVAEHIPAVFFVIGANVVQHPDLIRQEVADGFLVENHTWDHADFPGSALGTTPLTDAQALSEWTQTSAAIVAAGAPQPTLWRPPYGDTTDHYDYLASTLGLRLVMSWSNNGTIVDSRDTEGLSASQIASTVIAGLHGGVIIAMHDGDNNSSSTVASLPAIVNYMNANSLCATGTVPADATGGDGYINYGG